MHNFTSEDLLEFIYEETSSRKSAQIKYALQTDRIFHEKHAEVLEVCEKLETLKYAPRPQSILSILEYAEN